MMTIRDGAVMAMMDCQELGYVAGDAGVWGGSAGLDAAFADAKNKAAAIAGANAMMVTSSRMNPTAIVNATVFDCSDRTTEAVEVVEPPDVYQPLPISREDRDELFRRAKLCQERGGVWVNDQCVIAVD